MKKNCDSCYWQKDLGDWCYSFIEEPFNSICDNHEFTCVDCRIDKAEYTYKDMPYCGDCLMREFNVEESTVTHYHLDGEYLGDDNDYDSVIQALDDNIKPL